MRLGQEIEYVRKKCGLSIIDVCNAMDVSESEYHRIISYNVRPSIYQLIMFMSVARHSLDTI